jgi:hypothetical protein
MDETAPHSHNEDNLFKKINPDLPVCGSDMD